MLSARRSLTGAAALLILALAAPAVGQPPGARGAQAPEPAGRGDQAPPQGRGGPPGGRGAQPPRTARAAAPVDLTGYWVSAVTEDWRWRMVTPARGDFAGVPLNAAAASSGSRGTLPRMPPPASSARRTVRLRSCACPDGCTSPDRAIRRSRSRPTPARRPGSSSSDLPRQNRGPASWQGSSVAQWEPPMRGSGPADNLPIALNPREGTRGRALEVVTTNLREGYLRTNGAPYSARTTVREYFDVFTVGQDLWFTVTTIVEDPEYLSTPFVTSSNFKRQADATGWSPTGCHSWDNLNAQCSMLNAQCSRPNAPRRLFHGVASLAPKSLVHNRRKNSHELVRFVHQ